ncbi:MAG: hypothetical protein HON94_09920 [Methylococcales bacterium]|jgi:tetratricopeptide (TPR) repeat protein|nr:hypothetical protein [Methylococcales bacterium]MBT7408886.1 hypothetical protein [Methylococcales bacterium]
MIFFNIIRRFTFLLLLTFASIQYSLAADKVKITSEINFPRATFTIQFPFAVKIKSELKQSDFLLRFSRSWEPPNLEPYIIKYKDWVDTFWPGYDSLLIRVGQHVKVTVRKEGTKIIVDFIKKPPPAAKTVVNDFHAVRLARLHALYLADNRRFFEGLSQLRQLNKQYPKNVQVYLDLAIREEKIGRWQQAVVLYQQASKLSPNSHDIIAGHNRLLKIFGDQIKVQTDSENFTGGEHQDRITLSGQHNIFSHLQFAWQLQNYDIARENTRVKNGDIINFDQSIQRGKFHFEFDFEHATHGTLAFPFSENRMGLEFRHLFFREKHRTELTLTWQEPYWDLAEGYANDAYRSKIKLQHIHNLPLETIATLSLSLDQIGMSGLSKAAESIGFIFSLQHNVPIILPNLTFGYTFDGLYVQDKANRVDSDGITFSPIPLLKHEIHTLAIQWGDRIVDYLRAVSRIGYSVDEESGPNEANGKGPFLFFSLIYEPVSRLETGISYQKSRSTNRGGNVESNLFNAYILYRYH